MTREEVSVLDRQAVACFEALSKALPTQYEKLPDGRDLSWEAVGGAGHLFPGSRTTVRAVVMGPWYGRRNRDPKAVQASDRRVAEVKRALERWNANETSEWPLAIVAGGAGGK